MTDIVESGTENSNSVYGDVTAAGPAPVAEVTQRSIMEFINDTELKDHKALQNIKDVDSLAKSFIHAQSLVGKRVSEMTQEDMAQFNTNIGIPQDISGYEFEGEENLKKEALQLKLNKDQALMYADLRKQDKALADGLRITEREDKVSQYTRELEDAFGVDLPGKIELARKAAERLGGEDLLKAVFSRDNPANPAFIKALAAAGAEFGDHQSAHGQIRGSFSLTADEAGSKIVERRADKDFMRKAFDQSIPRESNAAWKELEHLYKLSKKDG